MSDSAGKLQIFVTDRSGKREEITDYLYWFEEEGLTSMTKEDFGGYNGPYTFEILIDSEVVWKQTRQ